MRSKFSKSTAGHRATQSNKRLERARHERASLLSCVGEPLKRSVSWLLVIDLFYGTRKQARRRVGWESLALKRRVRSLDMF